MGWNMSPPSPSSAPNYCPTVFGTRGHDFAASLTSGSVPNAPTAQAQARRGPRWRTKSLQTASCAPLLPLKPARLPPTSSVRAPEVDRPFRRSPDAMQVEVEPDAVIIDATPSPDSISYSQ
uniref:Uncharacterized protein n=1 Tax=Mycena chlorophos TaxID=658473 RepID=A0ABQ0L410_MYCCL|nr:predicted protein [Mycena chlorophos]